MNCPECGSDIKFSYIIPTKTFRIENGKIERDDAWTGPEYDTPYLEFYCSNDNEHDIDKKEVVEWSAKIEEEFYEKVFPTL